MDPTPSTASIIRQKFSVCRMLALLSIASRHHDKNLQCDYFDAEWHQRSLKRFEKVLHKNNKSYSSKVIFNVCNFTMSCFKSIVMISKSEDFYAPLLLERWIQTEASGGICSGVLRVSPIFQQPLLLNFITAIYYFREKSSALTGAGKLHRLFRICNCLIQ